MATETPNERFRRLATVRTNNVLRKLKILGNCANRHYYEYTDDDIRKIFSAIEKQVQEMKTRFLTSVNKEFKL